jgi:hypothetical protein
VSQCYYVAKVMAGGSQGSRRVVAGGGSVTEEVRRVILGFAVK